MTVSGLGTARTPLSPFTPVHRASRPEAPADRTEDHLTGRDRELIFQVTGVRDPAKQGATAFAAILATERAAGRLAPGQEAGALYLKDLNRRYERTGGPNPVAAVLPKALAYLSENQGGASRIDVSA
ncbi:hypothetical protein [Actinoplanes sp. M2I2]|uniref:hypothetical protein n=1 Tax=Actinoplanes sp. M2I2 TaxID=1734444 RepID=UPI00202286C5|nr:hypothetical protein [Actinoplanes sp. M2I2]